jgi:glycerol-3-phosphate dehydrogenase
VIIGAGIFGAAIAARIAATSARVCLVEKAGDVAEGASKGNAGITSSYYAAPGTLEARLTSVSNPRWEELCRRLNVPYRRIGALMPALNRTEAQTLLGQLDEARACGVRADVLSREQALALEPMISPHCVSALHLPDEGIIDPMRLTWGLAELAARNGVEVMFDSPVIGIDKSDGRIAAVRTPQETFGADYVVNTAGLHADLISTLAGGEPFRMWPRRGQYWVLDREFGTRLNHIVFATPAIDTKGIHVVPTSRGSVLLGPTVEELSDRQDKATTPDVLTEAFAAAQRLVPAVSLDYVIKTYSGLRPACEEPFFVRVDRSVPNLVHAVSRSIGVSTSLGVADLVLELLREGGLPARDRAAPVAALPQVPLLRHTEHPEEVTGAPANFSQVICVCEQVTAAEIEAALTARLPARSLDGVWKRTGAAGGRCQGTLCLSGIVFLCSVHGGCPPEALLAKDHGPIGIGRITDAA